MSAHCGFQVWMAHPLLPVLKLPPSSVAVTFEG